ncbi:MAG: pentapeptide repeat-containing protein [Anaerolineae bacterium]|jgi:BTB/POZ domain-containing protein KCTD9|nr:pentapeptide repeat-containing protein [Anaerolineae bacterium]
MKNRFAKIKKSIQVFFTSPFKIYVLLAILVIPFVIKLSSPFYDNEFLENVLVEAHGMLFDVLLLGVLVAWLNQGGKKQRTIKRYQEEIADYLGWHEPEATFRISGNIKRLNREGVSKINLAGAYLRRAKLSRANLAEADLSGADLSGAKLYYANFSGADFYAANLSKANLCQADLREAYLGQANFCGADLSEANLIGAKFNRTKRTGVVRNAASGKTIRTVPYVSITPGAKYDDYTEWPDGFDPDKAGARHVSAADLAVG